LFQFCSFYSFYPFVEKMNTCLYFLEMRCSLFFLVCWIVIAIKHPFTNAVERLLKTEEEFELIRWRRQSSGLYTHSFNEEFWHKSVDRPCKVYCPWQEEFVCWYRQKYVFSYIFKRLKIGLEICFFSERFGTLCMAPGFTPNDPRIGCPVNCHPETYGGIL